MNYFSWAPNRIWRAGNTSGDEIRKRNEKEKKKKRVKKEKKGEKYQHVK